MGFPWVFDRKSSAFNSAISAAWRLTLPSRAESFAFKPRMIVLSEGVLLVQLISCQEGAQLIDRFPSTIPKLP
jgi:hypothetical protein